MSTRTRRALRAAAVVTAVVAAAGTTVAAAGPGHGPKMKAPGLRLGVHVDISLIRANGSQDAFTMDRGKVTAESTTSVTLLRKDGKSVTLGLNAATKIRGDIQVDRGAVVFSRAGVAFAVLAPRGRRASHLLLGDDVGADDARLGKGLLRAVHADVSFIKADGTSDAFSFDRGDVTAASTTSLTVKRPDGPSITKTITADTKIRGKLAVGGKAALFSKGALATRILAVARRR